ncbi:hypothetical protein, partial [Saccharomonospora viridis]|uniref:hypothetical protein n=1 Tax=Saccharomonospora viridis TaxID=1852 RepID=UPI0024A7FCFC
VPREGSRGGRGRPRNSSLLIDTIPVVVRPIADRTCGRCAGFPPPSTVRRRREWGEERVYGGMPSVRVLAEDPTILIAVSLCNPADPGAPIR